MNISLYAFCKDGNGYRQNPDDYTKGIFDSFIQSSKTDSQILVRREKELMYYGYVCRLDGAGWFGLCIILNGNYIVEIKSLFEVFEKAMAFMVGAGYLIQLDIQLDSNSKIIVSNSFDDSEVEEVRSFLSDKISKLHAKALPSQDYSKGLNSEKTFNLQDDSEDSIVKSSYSESNTIIYKSGGLGARIGSYMYKIKQLSDRIKKQEKENAGLKTTLAKERRKRRNTVWVGILLFVIAILFSILWMKVLFPDEVTNYNAGDYMYYGPMKNGKPNGTGVAIYLPKDTMGRLYYYGNFVDGNRSDTCAIMFYRDGSYFRGKMENDKWENGLFYDPKENEHFVGAFRNNNPYKGDWYKHEFAQRVDEEVEP